MLIDLTLTKQCIAEGTTVRIRTTNGGETVVKLLEDYRPTYSVAVETDYGYRFLMLAERIRSIDVVINYWTAPLTEKEVADIRNQIGSCRKARTRVSQPIGR